MNRRDFLKTTAAATAATAVLGGEALAQITPDPYARPLHMVYAGNGGLSFTNADGTPKYQDSRFLTAFSDASVTSLTPFFLNVNFLRTPTLYASMIQSLKTAKITIIPAVGGPTDGNKTIFDQSYQDIAEGYAGFTKYIRLENMQGYLAQTNGRQNIQNMINFCIGKGFTHIMLNPWPRDSGGLVPFTGGSVLDSSFNNVTLNFDRTPPDYKITQDPTNWKVNATAINALHAFKSSVTILINYESAPQQAALTNEENDHQRSEADMQITLTDIDTYPVADKLRWAPPFTQSYDPFALGTWPWIAGKLNGRP